MTTPASSDEHVSRVPHAPADPTRSSTIRALVSVGASRESLLAAAIAVGVVIVVRFAVALVQLIGNAVAFDPASYSSGFLQSPIGLFLRAVVLAPLPFYAAAFVALTFLLPVTRGDRLSTALARTLLAGAVGTVVLALVGLATGLAPALNGGGGVGLALDVVFIPLSSGVLLTALLLLGATLAWLWLSAQGAVGGSEVGEVSAFSSGDAAESGAIPQPDDVAGSRDVAEPGVVADSPGGATSSADAGRVAGEVAVEAQDPAPPVSPAAPPPAGASWPRPRRESVERGFGDPAPASRPQPAAAERPPVDPDWSRFRPPAP